MGTTRNERSSTAPAAWQGRGGLARALRFAVFAIPLLTGMVGTLVAATLLPPPHGAWPTIGWWITVLGAGSAVSIATDRLAVRLLPLAALYSLTIAFPDRTPSRFAIARRATSLADARQAMNDLDAGSSVQEAAEAALALITALDVHHRATRGHAERVRLLTDLVGEELDLSDDDRLRLRWAALLHDLGKLHVHAEVLGKPDKPTDEEWEELRRHPIEGARLCEPLRPWLGDWALAVGEHHERYDGTGYPHGLRGEEISLAGRIVSVTDAYEVMTARRSYKVASTPQQARAELVACAGSHFDPGIVRAFLRVALPTRSRLLLPVQWVLSSPLVAQVRHAARQPLLAPLRLAATTGAPRLASAAAVAGMALAPAAPAPRTDLPPIAAPSPQGQDDLATPAPGDQEETGTTAAVDAAQGEAPGNEAPASTRPAAGAGPGGVQPQPAPDPEPAPTPSPGGGPDDGSGDPDGPPRGGSADSLIASRYALLAAAPTDHTARPMLPMGSVDDRAEGAPLNLDTDRDDLPGVRLPRGQEAPVTGLAGQAAWGLTADGPIVATGEIGVTAWVALDGFAGSGAIEVRADLLDCDLATSVCTPVATGTLSLDAPEPGGFTRVDTSLGGILHTLAPGRTLTLAFTATDASATDVLLAAGSTSVPSEITGLSIAPATVLPQ